MSSGMAEDENKSLSKCVRSIFGLSSPHDKGIGSNGTVSTFKCFIFMKSISPLFLCSWAHSGLKMGIILLSHCCPWMNQKMKMNKTNPMLSTGSAPPTKSPPQKGLRATPQVSMSSFSRDPTPVMGHCPAADM